MKSGDLIEQSSIAAPWSIKAMRQRMIPTFQQRYEGEEDDEPASFDERFRGQDRDVGPPSLPFSRRIARRSMLGGA